MRPKPDPGIVRHNEWHRVTPPAGAPALTVSVIIPCFDAAHKLSLTLAALERQDWPCERLEVVVVDDGSEPALQPPGLMPFALHLVRREGRGFSLAAARNAGARAASGALLLFLDADMIAEAGLVGAHARWHGALADALTLGFRNCISVSGLDADALRTRSGTVRALLAGRAFDPPWQERLMALTGGLTARREDLFRAASGCNLGIGRALFEELGGFDESFDRYGGEDTEFAWRVQVRGGVLVPVPDALAWHQGRWREGRRARRRHLAHQREKLAGLIALPGFRRGFEGRHPAVPRFVVTLEAGGASAARIAQAERTVLADTAGDAVVRINASARLERAEGADGRLCIGACGEALDAFPHSPLHLALPAGAVRPGTVCMLAAALGARAAVEVRLADGARASAAWAWALHRARRAGAELPAVGDTAVLELGRPRPGRTRLVRAAGRLLTAACTLPGPVGRAFADLARVVEEVRRVRGARDVRRLLRWLRAGAAWRLRRGR